LFGQKPKRQKKKAKIREERRGAFKQRRKKNNQKGGQWHGLAKDSRGGKRQNRVTSGGKVAFSLDHACLSPKRRLPEKKERQGGKKKAS